MEIMHWRYTGNRILQNISSVLSLELERRKCIMSEMMKAPRINHWINVLRGGKMVFNKETNETIDRVFEQLHLIAPCGDDERREIWLKAERGSAEDYDDYEYLKEEEIVDTYEDFLRMWQEEYPDEVNWFHLVTIERDDYRAIFLGRELIYQSRVYEEHEVYEYGLKELFVWMEEAVKKCVEDLQNGSYNCDVQNNLSARQRTGTISRKDYWEMFPDCREAFFSEITDAEIEIFLSNIEEQKDGQPVGKYITEMTAGKFYEYCAIGYKANQYENLDGLTAKEQYYKKADGRDEGLSEIDADSSEEFEAWYNDRHRGGGHPWEVCRGGNSTHIDLFVRHNEHGYFLSVRGKAWTRSIEAIKFYNALRQEGVAVYLHDAKGISDRLLGRDRIGIVPEHVIPAYCESWFSGMEILDFMNLPYEQDEYEAMLPKITWLEEQRQELMKKSKFFVSPYLTKSGIRRCGKSSLMKLMAEHLRDTGVTDDQIIEMNFESMGIPDMDARGFYEYVKARICPNKRTYLFFDEVQKVHGWENAVNSFRVDFDCDIYITGSNAYLLSSELSTYLSGRYVEIKVLPLSFREFLDFHGYILTERKSPALDGVYSAAVINDILEREKRKGQRNITDPVLLKKIILFLADNVGNNTSATSIGNTLVNEGLLENGTRKTKPAVQTIQAYIEALTEAYIFYEIKRFDIKGKEYLRTLGKYYIVDIGLRNYLLGYRDGDSGHILENIIYFELLRRGYDVAIGKIDNQEVDFIATKADEKKYVQVTESMNAPETRERELAPLRKIRDSYEKIVIALECNLTQTQDGIKIIRALDFLLE